MIPKKIHYCWFGENPLPEIAIKCMSSWKEYCPDYEIIRWDESNCDLSINQFVKEAYENKKWAFVSDYFRLKVVEEHGGVYLDIDVELLKPLDDLLQSDGYMGFELGEKHYINSGLGFAAIAKQPVIEKLRESYENIPFVKTDGSFDTTPCPRRDTKVLVKLGLQQNNREQEIDGITFVPATYFSPLSYLGEENFTNKTYSIHHFNASWRTPEKMEVLQCQKQLINLFGSYWGRRFIPISVVIYEIKKNGLKLIGKIRKR